VQISARLRPGGAAVKSFAGGSAQKRLPLHSTCWGVA
jgi:hypothetical protein